MEVHNVRDALLNLTYPVHHDIIRFFRQVKVSQSFFISLTILVVARFEKTRR